MGYYVFYEFIGYNSEAFYLSWYLMISFTISLVIWYFIVLLRSIKNFSPITKLKQVGFVVVLLVIYYLPVSYFSDITGTFWYSSYKEDSVSKENPYDKINVENVFYQQFDMIQSLRDGLLNERQGITDLYFLGFASYAMQDVFYKEVNYAKKIMDSRFDTSGRSAVLINNLKSLDKDPLANNHNLAFMLNGMAERMNVDEDILFLYLTSHGSKKHELTINFWPLNLNNITPEILKNQLDESGIKWRIILVSACYSGGYIKPLENENTLVFTASATDRKSFGCNNTNEFTWFGEAVFKFALNKSYSMIEAFEQAKVYIRDKEKLQQVDKFSLPQLSVGKNIKEKLYHYSTEMTTNSTTGEQLNNSQETLVTLISKKQG